MAKLKHLLVLVFIALSFPSCTKKDVDTWNISGYEVRFFTVIRNDKSNVVYNYRHAYGIGADSVIRKQESQWLNAIGWGPAPIVTDSFAFPLRLDANRDSVMYCFVANDNTRDSVGINYTRKFSAHIKEGYKYVPENIKLFFLSSRLLADSCTVHPSKYYMIYDYDNFIQVNLRLMLKP